MYFLVLFEPTNQRAIYQNDEPTEKLTVEHLLKWIHKRFHFESSSGETGNRRLVLLYNNTELQPQWFLQDINIRFGSTVKCIVKEGVYLVIIFICTSCSYNLIDVPSCDRIVTLEGQKKKKQEFY